MRETAGSKTFFFNERNYQYLSSVLSHQLLLGSFWISSYRIPLFHFILFIPELVTSSCQHNIFCSFVFKPAVNPSPNLSNKRSFYPKFFSYLIPRFIILSYMDSSSNPGSAGSRPMLHDISCFRTFHIPSSFQLTFMFYTPGYKGIQDNWRWKHNF